MLTMATRWPHSWVLTCAKLRGCPPDATNFVGASAPVRVPPPSDGVRGVRRSARGATKDAEPGFPRGEIAPHAIVKEGFGEPGFPDGLPDYDIYSHIW